jgi:hypothetical protein
MRSIASQVPPLIASGFRYLAFPGTAFDALRAGDTALVGNKGYRRYLKSTGHRFEIDEAKIAADARFDGKWVLTILSAWRK